jgi:hypothetical protein
MPLNFIPFCELDISKFIFALGQERQGKPTIAMVYGDHATEVAVVTPACITNWPRCSGDGNFGTMWGPTDPMKTKFTLDLNDTPINGEENTLFAKFAAFITAIDDRRQTARLCLQQPAQAPRPEEPQPRGGQDVPDPLGAPQD